MIKRLCPIRWDGRSKQHKNLIATQCDSNLIPKVQLGFEGCYATRHICQLGIDSKPPTFRHVSFLWVFLRVGINLETFLCASVLG